MLLNFTTQMKSLTAQEKYLSQSMTTKNSPSENIETNCTQIFTKERRNSEKRFWPSTKPTINKWEEVDKVKAEDMAMVVLLTHHNHMVLHLSNSSTLNNNITNSSNINNSSMLSHIMVPQNNRTTNQTTTDNDKSKPDNLNKKIIFTKGTF